MEVPVTRDLVQEVEGNLEAPEIRVWCHPHKIGQSGDDYWQVCESFQEAVRFIGAHPEAEETPLIAFRGYEFNLFAVEPAKPAKNKRGVK